MSETHQSIKLINGQELQAYPATESPVPCTDIDLFAANVNMLIANAERIFADSRMFMCPIDMNCGLAYSGKFRPVILGVYLEFWLNSEFSRDNKGNPIVRLSGSPLSGCNKCAVALPDGRLHFTAVSRFSGSYRSFLHISAQYRDYIGKYEAYPLGTIVNMLNADSIAHLKTDNLILQRKNDILERTNEALKADIKRLEGFIAEKTEEYLAAILQPRIRELKELYSAYTEIKDYTQAIIRQHDKAKADARERLQNKEIKQEEYIAIKKAENEAIMKLKGKLDEFWFDHFSRLYYDNVRFFGSVGDVVKYLPIHKE